SSGRTSRPSACTRRSGTRRSSPSRGGSGRGASPGLALVADPALPKLPELLEADVVLELLVGEAVEAADLDRGPPAPDVEAQRHDPAEEPAGTQVVVQLELELLEGAAHE